MCIRDSHRIEQRILEMGRNTRAIIFNVDAGGEAITHPVQRQLESGAGAVSYTHLDVYKRQVKTVVSVKTGYGRDYT